MSWSRRVEEAEKRVAAKDASARAWPCCYSRCIALEVAETSREEGELSAFISPTCIPRLEEPSSIPSRAEPRYPKNVVFPFSDGKPSPFAKSPDGQCCYRVVGRTVN